MEMLGLAALIIFWLVAIALGVLSFVFWIVEIIDICRRQFRDPTMKIVWLLIVIFTHFIGALIYFFIGKRDGVLPGETMYGS